MNEIDSTLIACLSWPHSKMKKVIINHFSERASALDCKDAATPRFGHCDVVLNLFIEIRFFALNLLLIQFFKSFLAF